MFLHPLMTLLDFLLFRRDLLAFLLAFLLNFTSSHQIDRQSVFLCFQIRNKFNFQNQLTSLLIKTKRSSTRHQQYMRTFCTRKTSKTKVTKSPLSSKNNGEFSIELGIPQNEVNALRRLWRGVENIWNFSCDKANEFFLLRTTRHFARHQTLRVYGVKTFVFKSQIESPFGIKSWRQEQAGLINSWKLLEYFAKIDIVRREILNSSKKVK